MTRKERLSYCTVCSLRAFDRNKGVVCSITNEHAIFEVNCKDFRKDEELSKKQKEKKAEIEKTKLDKETWGLSALGIKNLVVVGLIFMSLSLAVGLLLYFKFQLVSLYPVIVFVLSVITIGKGLTRNKKQKNKLSKDILDDSI